MAGRWYCSASGNLNRPVCYWVRDCASHAMNQSASSGPIRDVYADSPRYCELNRIGGIPTAGPEYYRPLPALREDAVANESALEFHTGR